MLSREGARWRKVNQPTASTTHSSLTHSLTHPLTSTVDSSAHSSSPNPLLATPVHSHSYISNGNTKPTKQRITIRLICVKYTNLFLLFLTLLFIRICSDLARRRRLRRQNTRLLKKRLPCWTVESKL
jgi:hypothetical protein